MKRFTLALAIAFPIVASAQARPDPADPKIAVPPLRYESALGGYRPFRDEGPAPWKQVNEEVKGLGGHAAHAPTRKDAPPAAVPSAAKPAAIPPASKKPEPAAPAKPAEHKH